LEPKTTAEFIHNFQEEFLKEPEPEVEEPLEKAAVKRKIVIGCFTLGIVTIIFIIALVCYLALVITSNGCTHIETQCCLEKACTDLRLDQCANGVTPRAFCQSKLVDEEMRCKHICKLPKCDSDKDLETCTTCPEWRLSGKDAPEGETDLNCAAPCKDIKGDLEGNPEKRIFCLKDTKNCCKDSDGRNEAQAFQDGASEALGKAAALWEVFHGRTPLGMYEAKFSITFTYGGPVLTNTGNYELAIRDALKELLPAFDVQAEIKISTARRRVRLLVREAAAFVGRARMLATNTATAHIHIRLLKEEQARNIPIIMKDPKFKPWLQEKLTDKNAGITVTQVSEVITDKTKCPNSPNQGLTTNCLCVNMDCNVSSYCNEKAPSGKFCAKECTTSAVLKETDDPNFCSCGGGATRHTCSVGESCDMNAGTCSTPTPAPR